MAISISGSNSISGLGGQDTDFDKVLSQLKKIEQTQLRRLEAWKSDWNLRYEAFSTIIEQVQAASSMLSQLGDKNNFVTKLVQSSNENIVTAVANASAQDVQHTISVSQVASNAIWANTGHVFESKNDVINDTGTDQYFSYTYAGKRHDFKVPANTSLDSFVSMINNSTDNPGIKVSMIQTGKGYVFQVAGKSTGASNDLIIHDSNLVGMKSAGTTSTWRTNDKMDISASSITNPTSYTFDLVLASGAKKSVTVKGDATAQEVADTLNRAAGGINATVDPATGELTIAGVQSFSRRKTSEDAYTPPSLRVNVPAWMDGDNYVQLNAAGGVAEGLGADDMLRFTMTLDDGSTREVEIRAGATNRDLMVALAQATQEGDSVNVGISGGKWGVQLSGVTAIQVDALDASGAIDSTKTIHADRLDTKLTDAKGVKQELGAKLKATTTITFEQAKLGDRIDGKSDGDGTDFVFTLVAEDGTAHNISLKRDITQTPPKEPTNQELLVAIKAYVNGPPAVSGITMTEGTDGSGNATLELKGVKSLKLARGGISKQGFSTTLESSMTVPATTVGGDDPTKNLFYSDGSVPPVFTMEKAPDLVYTIKANDGSTGTLTMASGSSMKDILNALADKTDGRWVWKDSGDNSAAAPADFEAIFTDADGVRYMKADGVTPMTLDEIDGPVYLNFKNITSASGPQVVGQVAESSNWNIQRAANARYQVDNWPVEMESDTNTLNDVIEGVVFSIQDKGEARISVSTDITSVEQSIQNFLDAVNSVLLTVNDLMKFDETKQVTSNDPDDIGNENYSPSGLTNQKGGLLMGNYGVQLFKSRFSNVITSTPPGFKSMQSADNLLSGDVLASLANLGIKTDTDQNSDTYGLLVLAPTSGIGALQSMDKENYNKLITNNLEAVVDFFCSSGTGSSTSTDFRYSSHVEGITKAGSYDVTYTVDAGGHITKVMVGGAEAKRDDSQPGNYYTVASGDARGLAILIDDLTPGDHPPAGAEPMQVRIKQGLVQTVNTFLKDELVFNNVNISANATPSQIADAVALKSKNGALMSLRDNYMTVMEGIDEKIEREQRRIQTWEARQKAIFANLETLLKQYSQQQESLEAQIKQLGGSK